MGGKTYQSIAGADVEIDIGQRLDVLEAIDLGDEFQEEAQLADLIGLFHDIHTGDVENYARFQDEVGTARMWLDSLQDRQEVGDIGGVMLPLWGYGCIQHLVLFDQVLYAFQAGLVESFEDGKRREQERARSAGRVKDGHLLDTVIQRPQEVGARAVGDHVLGKATAIQIVRDEVIGRRDLARCQFRSQILVACASRHDLAPGLRWQGVCFRRGPVPLAALHHVVYARLNFGRQWDVAPFLDGIIDIGVRVLAQQGPDWAVGAKGDQALLLGSIEQKRKDGTFADVLGDVFFGIVGPHLLLVDVFLEDVAEHGGLDLAIAAQRAVIQVPVELIEEREELFKRLVGDGDLRVRALQHMRVEKASIEIRHLAQQRFEFRCMLALAQSFVKEVQQEVAVEGMELSLSPFLQD